jgi:hypothetical protein
MIRLHHLSVTSAALAAATLLAACGGGGDSTPQTPAGTGSSGTMRLSLTDAPSCGYDNAFVTVDRVRVHQSSSAVDGDAGWSEVVLAAPQRVDLLTLNNGTLLPLGQTELPAGTYTQMRLVLAANSASNPLANAITPSGGAETALTTPSGAQSGLKMNVNLVVPSGQVADFAIDFDACKSFVKAGNSGKYLLKPVLSVIPILSVAGQRIVGFVNGALANTGTTVSAQVGGLPVRATPPDVNGRFVLYPVPVGTYDLVITASGRVNAVITGVPVEEMVSTVIGSDAARIDTPTSAINPLASGRVTVGGNASDTGAAVRAVQSFAGGILVETGYSAADSVTGFYGLRMPAGAPAWLAYAAGATTFSFNRDGAAVGLYRLEANAPGFVALPLVDITLTTDLTRDFRF